MTKDLSPRLIFDGPDLRLVYVPAEKRGPLVVTFSPLVHQDFDPPVGFGQEFFAKRGLACLCFISAWPHWWQVPDIEKALSIAREVVRQHSRVITYGSSMGGHGALLHSRALGATTVIAAAPQFSIDPAKAPFERRWRHRASKLTFNWDDMKAGLAPKARKYIIYDPLSIDRKHVQRLRSPRIIRVGLPFSGHAPLAYLSHIGLLSDTILSMIGNKFSLLSLKEAVRAQRRGNPDYWGEMALALQQRGRYQAAVEALRTAKSLDASAIQPRLRLAQNMWRLGLGEEALQELEEAVTMRPRHEGARKLFASMLAQSIQSVSEDPAKLEALHERYRSAIDSDGELQALISAPKATPHLTNG
ncbi:hypothetical protein IAI18_17140 [Acetobacteraceae bacterium H6797]|nr:hypothetical protein [Acetobacteraceae bacterium H6797]